MQSPRSLRLLTPTVACMSTIAYLSGFLQHRQIFQRTIENTLQNLTHTCVYLDDILITGKTETDHIRNLEEVLTCLEKAGLRLKKQKCSFMLTSVDYLGHTISSEGLQPTREKVRAIKDAPTPTNVAQLRSFLGLVNYYGKFLPQLAHYPGSTLFTAATRQ